MYEKWWSYMMYASWDIKCDRQNFLSFLAIFCPFTTVTTQKIKIWRKWKNTWRYYHFTHMYHKWQSYDVWFLRYRVWQTEFLPFYPTNNPKIKFLKELKKHLEISSFYISVPKIMIICYTVPEILHMTDVIFIFHFGLFFVLLFP